MILFLDTSVLLAACGSTTGAAHFVCRNVSSQGWTLLTSGYCVQETLRNLPKIGPAAASVWQTKIQSVLQMVPDALTMGERALVFPKAKDRPVVITALAAEAAVLLTLDRTDFHGALGQQIYGMSIRSPADFLMERRIIWPVSCMDLQLLEEGDSRLSAAEHGYSTSCVNYRERDRISG